jgi:hypothetical protein
VSFLPDPIRDAINDAARPRRVDVVRAKDAVLAALADGASVHVRDLQFALLDELGISRQDETRDSLTFSDSDDADAVDAEHPLVIRERLRIATRIAITELVTDGLLVEVEDPGNIHVSIPVQRGGQSGRLGLRIGSPSIATGGGYELSRRVDADLYPIFDADIFAANLEGLALDARALRCLREALEAFRRGLYLAAVTLLGAVSESAWWSVAERLRGTSVEIDRVLNDDRTSIATLIRTVADDLASRDRSQRSLIEELHARAGYLRDLRNYGIHSRDADENASQEQAFTEAGAGLLLLSARRYLEQLSSLVPGQ